MYFRCGSCNAVYWDYYPIDDCCIKCGRGLIRFIPEPDCNEADFSVSGEENDDQDTRTK